MPAAIAMHAQGAEETATVHQRLGRAERAIPRYRLPRLRICLEDVGDELITTRLASVPARPLHRLLHLLQALIPIVGILRFGEAVAERSSRFRRIVLRP